MHWSFVVHIFTVGRFHILCSHLLCEEDTMTFDPRMNNENLNKCLLSLKEFYRDLRVEKVQPYLHVILVLTTQKLVEQKKLWICRIECLP